MLERLSWKKLLLELIYFCLPAGLLGLIIGQVALLLAIALAAALLWHYYNLLKLSHWLWLDKNIMPPSGRGSWEPLFYGLHQLQQRNRQRRRELTQLIKRFRSGAESLPDAIVLSTEQGNIFWCNHLAQHLLGLHWPEDSGQHLLNLIRQPQFASYLAKGDFRQPMTLELAHQRYLEFRIMPYIEGQLLIVARDVTQIHMAEGNRHRFFTNVSHELRTPLTVLQGYLELLNDSEPDNSDKKKALQAMCVQSERMASLVNQLLTLSRIESMPQLSLTEVVPVPDILAELEKDALSLSNQRHQLHFHVSPELQVYGNAEQLRSALSNLIYNAINHTPDGVSIDVYWRKVPQGAQFCVADNGPGIATEHLNHLTERFYRVDNSRSRGTGGSGLGLAIVKHALNHHDARLEITSRLGQGSCFQFTLPKNLIVSDPR